MFVAVLYKTLPVILGQWFPFSCPQPCYYCRVSMLEKAVFLPTLLFTFLLASHDAWKVVHMCTSSQRHCSQGVSLCYLSSDQDTFRKFWCGEEEWGVFCFQSGEDWKTEFDYRTFRKCESSVILDFGFVHYDKWHHKHVSTTRAPSAQSPQITKPLHECVLEVKSRLSVALTFPNIPLSVLELLVWFY